MTRNGERYSDTYDDVEHPVAVRCWLCGGLTTSRETDQCDEESTVVVYGCQKCRVWYEFEFYPDADDLVCTNAVVRNMDNENTTMWVEARGWPNFWMPDGWDYPEAVL